MNLNLKPPAYSRGLLKRRAKGWLPWLVVVAEGAAVDWSTLRGNEDVARVGVGHRFPIEQADWRCIMGLDVLVSSFPYAGLTLAAQERRRFETLRVLSERGQPSTLWELVEGHARQLHVFTRGTEPDKGRHDFEPALQAFAVGKPEFARALALARRGALLRSKGVYASPAFDGAREALLEELTG